MYHRAYNACRVSTNQTNFNDQKEGVLDTISQYPSTQAIERATAAQYQTFLSDDLGVAAHLVGKYYPLSLFQASVGNSTGWAVFEAMATVLTDAHFKCPGYKGLLEAARKIISVWTYEFTHNSSCVWLDTMEQSAISVYGATRTAERPYLFGNLEFDLNTNCNSTPTEYILGKQMRKLWTAMAENGNPSTDDVQWPRFEVTANDSSTPSLIISNSTVPGLIDYSVCPLWAKVIPQYYLAMRRPRERQQPHQPLFQLVVQELSPELRLLLC